MIEIRHRYNLAILCSLDAPTIKEALQAGIKSGADLRGANFSGANLKGSNLSDLQLAQFKICPEGQLIVWKKLSNSMAKLAIPENAKRVNAIGSRKCRADKALVLEIVGFGGAADYDKHTGTLLYRVGEWVFPDKFDDSPFEECSNGIHFFLTREEAEAY